MVNEQIFVRVDSELEDLIPGFMQRRRDDVSALRSSLAESELEKIRICGHSMKGTGGGYGFHEITIIGGALEDAAIRGDQDKISELIDRLEEFLDNVVIEFRP